MLRTLVRIMCLPAVVFARYSIGRIKPFSSPSN